MKKPKKPKIIIVGTVLGRVGSSAMMGILKLAGCNVGGRKTGFNRPISPSPKNYFEIRGLAKFFSGMRPICYPSYRIMPPTLNTLNIIRNKYYKQFEKILINEFGGKKFPIAFKGACMLAIPLLNKLNKYDVRVVVMNRDRQGQLDSIVKAGIPLEKYEKLRDAWIVFEKKIIKKYNKFKYHYVDYDDFMSRSVKTVNNVIDFIDMKRLPKGTIKKWIDPKLVTGRNK